MKKFNIEVVFFHGRGGSAGRGGGPIQATLRSLPPNSVNGKIRITDHLRNIVTKDSTNAPLRLAVADVFATQSPVAMANANNT